MKKLMIAVAIVCAAAMTQAAQFNWQSGGIKDIDGKTVDGLIATLVLTEVESGNITTQFSTTVSAGKIAALIGDDSAGDAGFIKQGNHYTGYFTMVDAKGNTYQSAIRSNVAATYKTAAAFATGPGSWTPAPIPEPTSGLLLLLGVAGLALRRRRA